MNLLFANDKAGEYPDSYYRASANLLPELPQLEEDIQCDVCVVGAGYTGLSTALHLANRGIDVVLLDAQRVGWGASGRNGGQVGEGYSMDQLSLEKKVGVDAAHALWDISTDAVSLVQELIKKHSIKCEWKHGVVSAQWKSRNMKHVDSYVKTMRENYGFEQLELLSASDMQRLLGTDVYAGGMLNNYAGQIHPLKFALGLAVAAVKAGVRIFERSQVMKIRESRSVTITTDKAKVYSANVVLACNGYLGNLNSSVKRRVMPINNFIAATEPLNHITPKVLPAELAVFDSKFVVNYFRLSSDNRLLFGGGENYGLQFPKDIQAVVSKPMRQVFPQLESVKLDFVWGGTLAITPTRMPYFASPGKFSLSASGYSGHGVAMATMAGKVLADALAGDSHRFDYLSNVPMVKFPGGNRSRAKLLALAMTWFAMLDKLP